MRQLSLLLVVLAMVVGSCQALLTEALDCVSEAVLLDLDAREDDQNSRFYSFALTYSGDKSIEGITYAFGDGNSTRTTATLVTHTYAIPGEYTVTATIDLKQGKNTCTLEETVDIIVL